MFWYAFADAAAYGVAVATVALYLARSLYLAGPSEATWESEVMVVQAALLSVAIGTGCAHAGRLRTAFAAHQFEVDVAPPAKCVCARRARPQQRRLVKRCAFADLQVVRIEKGCNHRLWEKGGMRWPRLLSNGNRPHVRFAACMRTAGKLVLKRCVSRAITPLNTVGQTRTIC